MLFAALLLYHAMGVWHPGGTDLFSLYRLATVAVASLFVGFTVWTSIVPRLLSFRSFIAGTYTGHATRTDETGEGRTELRFTISQNMFETIVVGVSVWQDTRKPRSSWRGTRYQVNDDCHFFAMAVALETGPEYGILNLTIVDGNVTGFYWSGNPKENRQYTIEATRSK